MAAGNNANTPAKVVAAGLTSKELTIRADEVPIIA